MEKQSKAEDMMNLLRNKVEPKDGPGGPKKDAEKEKVDTSEKAKKELFLAFSRGDFGADEFRYLADLIKKDKKQQSSQHERASTLSEAAESEQKITPPQTPLQPAEEDWYDKMARAGMEKAERKESGTSFKSGQTQQTRTGAERTERVPGAKWPFGLLNAGTRVKFEGEEGWIIDSYITDGPGAGRPIIRKNNKRQAPSMKELFGENFRNIPYRNSTWNVVGKDKDGKLILERTERGKLGKKLKISTHAKLEEIGHTN